MRPELKQRLTAKAIWMRGLYIVLFAVIFGITRVVLWAVVILQFLLTLFTGETNTQLRAFGLSLAAFVYQIMAFVTFNSDQRPFPFDPWPESVIWTRGARPSGPESGPQG